ncbi:MAG: hypothetical protein ABH885_06300, partial [Candidatus Omnitrophota bacterium]
MMKRLLCLLSAVIFLLAQSGIGAHAYDEASSMVKISGNYGMSMGVTPQEWMLKDANGDYQEKNWRYANVSTPGFDTYDPRIFDRYELEIETDTNTPINAYVDIKIDPWSFVGVGRETVRNAWNDQVTVEYKYWEATGKTINERYRTRAGNAVDYNELKVIQDKVTHDRENPLLWGSPAFDFSLNRSVEIDYLYRPIRKLWVEYKQEPLYIKVFPIADQAEAFTSDDPLGLSNHHVYWAPSPWLWSFYPGQTFTDGNQEKARWNWDLNWYAEDSNREFLTFLRGFSIQYNATPEATLSFTAAAPMSLWDYYEEVDSIPMAARLKLTPTGKLTIGATYTGKYGINKKELRASNHVLGLDGTYNLFGKTDVFGEVALSRTHIEYFDDQNQHEWGAACKVGLKSEHDNLPYNSKIVWDLTFTNMSDDFDPGLADYRDSRVDRDWGRHIFFDPISTEDAAIRIGDSVDVDRYVFGANARLNSFGEKFELYVNFRNARDSHNKFIENVCRAEATCNPIPRIQIKGLALYRAYPDTVGNWDPFIYNRYEDTPYRNYQVADGKNADLMTFSGGAKVDLIENLLSAYGIFETTNDPQDFPRSSLSNIAYNTLVNEDDIIFNELMDQVYRQDIFDLPPYEFYDIWKGVIILTPVPNVLLRYTHVTNGNRNYAALYDDNHNHDAIDISFSPVKDITVNCGYSYSRMIDLRRAVDTAAREQNFRPHHNFYSQINWRIMKDQLLTLQFGEMWIQEDEPGVFGTKWASTRFSVLDTVKIFR